jgi:hypothetical protein
MKKVLALGLAAAMAATTVGVTVEAASAQPKWQNNGGGNWDYKRHHHNGGYWRGGNFIAPFLLGGAIGYGLGQSYYPNGYGYGYDYDYGYAPSYGYGGNAHVQWCASHYRTYNPATNTFFVRPGVPRVCVSPYG